MQTKEIEKKALSYYEQGFNCAESVLKSLAEAFGIKSSYVPRIASGFGGGFGKRGEVCGVISGAVMVLGIKYGRDSGKEKEKKEKLYGRVYGLMDAFTKKFKSTGCMEILGCDLSTPEGLDKYKKEGLRQSKCMKLISFAVKETIKISENW